MIFNAKKIYCYRICHIDNLAHILKFGLCTQHHVNANPTYKSIGNPDIIGDRDKKLVKIPGYGVIGDYIPFYFTPKSIMLLNIITGYRKPLVPQLPKEDIIIFCCLIEDLGKDGRRFFFTNGQASTTSTTKHYNDLKYISEIDWISIHSSNFDKQDDPDRPRRYQAEILVHHHLPVNSLSSIIVYNENAASLVRDALVQAGIVLNVYIVPKAYFD